MAARMILPQGTKAPDANLLDGIDSTLFTQDAFKTIKVSSTDVTADLAEDTLEISAGSNIAVTPDAINDKITISIAEDTTHRFVSDLDITNWDQKQDPLGYTPINKAGDSMTGELQTPSLNVGGKFKFVYDPSSDSLVLEVN